LTPREKSGTIYPIEVLPSADQPPIPNISIENIYGEYFDSSDVHDKPLVRILRRSRMRKRPITLKVVDV